MIGLEFKFAGDVLQTLFESVKRRQLDWLLNCACLASMSAHMKSQQSFCLRGALEAQLCPRPAVNLYEGGGPGSEESFDLATSMCCPSKV